ncbi:MAG TPA: S9 family peptidase [Vicinamibacterales bacterium]|nr:S9 family peptidase [Vicinamibacterales bacterium]
MKSATPSVDQRPVERRAHGTTRTDEFAWLRADNWQDVIRDPARLPADIRAYLDAENAYTATMLAPTEALQERLFAEMKGRIAEDDESVPEPDGPWEYFTAFHTGAQYARFVRRPRSAGAAHDQVYFDGNLEAAGTAYFRLGDVVHAPDHSRFAYAVDTVGSEIFDVRVREFDGSTRFGDALADTEGRLVWAADSLQFFYTVLDRNHRPHRVFRHQLGTAQASDALIYEEADPGFFVSLGLSENRRFVVISSGDHVTTEVHLVDMHSPDTVPRLVAARQHGVEYRVHTQGDDLVILTNADGAEDFKVVRVAADAPERANWRDWMPHVPGRLIESVVCFAGEVVRLERDGGLQRIVVRHDDGSEHTIGFDEPVFALAVQPGFEYDTAVLRFTYTSLTTPDQTFDYDMRTRVRTLRKQQRVPSGHDPARYRSARVFASSHDGAQVPISLLWHASTPLDGSAPVLLHGYGSYGIAIPPGFGIGRLSLVDRGFIWALAHIRGGKDKGYGWYRQGRLLQKRNTFLDFIAAAEHLCAGSAALTRPGQITIEGGSAGGLLVGAVVNMRPELFKAAVAHVPFVDVLNTICDGELPLTPIEWPEWGNPIVSREVFDYIASYSPYDNVARQAYPSILVTAGLTDPRVTYWEPAKWVARLRARKTDDNLLLLRTYMEAGHAGKSGRFARLRETALHYAFVLLVNDRLE